MQKSSLLHLNRPSEGSSRGIRETKGMQKGPRDQDNPGATPGHLVLHNFSRILPILPRHFIYQENLIFVIPAATKSTYAKKKES